MMTFVVSVMVSTTVGLSARPAAGKRCPHPSTLIRHGRGSGTTSIQKLRMIPSQGWPSAAKVHACTEVQRDGEDLRGLGVAVDDRFTSPPGRRWGVRVQSKPPNIAMLVTPLR